MTEHHVVCGEEETLALAEAFGRTLRPGDIVAYRGGMGMGKTLFTRGLAGGMGLDPGRIASPTFALVHEHRDGDICLYHFDMYRVVGEEGLASTGFFDYLESDGVLAIEWSENIAEFLPEEAVVVTFSPGESESCRLITVEDRRIL